MDAPLVQMWIGGVLNFVECLRKDFGANPSNAKAKLLLIGFRTVHVFAVRKSTHPWLWVCALPLMAAYRVIFEWILGMELPARTQVGAGLTVMHGQGLVVNYNAVIGQGCTLRQCTTIGCKVLPNGESGPSPILGDNVDVGSNVVILGGIKLGNGCVVGAGSVVVRDVPSGAVVVGNPARIISWSSQMQQGEEYVTTRGAL